MSTGSNVLDLLSLQRMSSVPAKSVSIIGALVQECTICAEQKKMPSVIVRYHDDQAEYSDSEFDAFIQSCETTVQNMKKLHQHLEQAFPVKNKQVVVEE